MSSKRGRKRNDNLPPNRARDVQRAFRARRAAHLQALEQRVSELEEENSCLRQALNLPQANRPPLGKGPTGKDKPKSYDGNPIHSSRESSSADSPDSMRESVSPVLVSASLPPRAAQDIENGTGAWGQTIAMPPEEQPQYQPLPPMSAPPTMSAAKSMPYSSPYPSSRSSSLAPMYMYGSSERSIPAYSTHFEQQQQQQQRSYSYTSTPQSYAEANGRDVAPANSVTLGYPPRRGTADFSLGQHFPHLPPVQVPTSIRMPSPPRGLEPQQQQQQQQTQQHHDLHGHHSQHDPHVHHRPAYTSDGRIIS